MISFLLRNLPPSSASPLPHTRAAHLRKVGPGWGEALLATAQLRSRQAIGTVTMGVYRHRGYVGAGQGLPRLPAPAGRFCESLGPVAADVFLVSAVARRAKGGW